MTQPEHDQSLEGTSVQVVGAPAVLRRRRTDRAPLGLVSRREAARMLGISLGSFDAHVRPELLEKKIGRLVAFRQAELEAWVAREPEPEPERKAGPEPRRTYAAASAPVVVDMHDPLVRETLQRMRAKRAAGAARKAKAGHQPSKAP